MMPFVIQTLDHVSAARDSLASTAMNGVRRINTATNARSCVAVRMEGLAIISRDIARVLSNGLDHSKSSYSLFLHLS